MKKKGKKKWIIIVVIVVIALFGAVGGRGSDKADLEDDKTQDAAEQTVIDEGEEVETADEDAGENAAADEAEKDADANDVNELAPDGIRPELKEFLDSYEAFMYEYCEFMLSYDSNDTSQLLKYASLMEKYYEFSEKAEAWDEEDMTDEEILYHLKVMNRVNEKLLETEVALG